MNHTILKIDKTNWKPVKFGDVVAEPKEICKDIVAEGIEHVVGLEHIDTGDLHLRKSATIEESTTFSKKFRKGDVLFGRRRAYLKKAAQADFDGICSGDITVFRVKKELSSALLPFIVNNDKFFDYAVKHSAGGLSPRVKFKDLANYEFLLPPKAEQARLAELLWAMDDVIEKEKGVLERLEMLFKNVRNHFVENGTYDSINNSKKTRFGKVCANWQLQKLSSFAELMNGYAFKSEEFLKSGKFQVLRIGNITDNGFDFSKAPVFKNVISENERKFLIPKGAIVLSLTGTNGKRDYGFPSLMVDDKKFLLNQRLIMIIPKKEVMLPEFLFLLSKMEIFQGRFFLNATGTANQANVSSSDVSLIELPVPPIDDQVEFLKIIDSLRSGIANSNKKITASQSLQKSLINQIF